MGAGRRKLVVGALCACAAFAWGCESKRAAPEGGDNARMQPPSMSAPDGERSAGSGETLRRGQMPEENGTPNPAELPGGREMRGFGGAGEEGSAPDHSAGDHDVAPGSSTHPVDEECAQQPAQTQQQRQTQPADPQQQQPAQTQQGAGTGGAGPDQGNTGVAPEESRAVRDEATTIIVPGGAEGLDAATLKDAERAAQDAREGDSDERIVIANVEFGGRLQEVGPERVVVRDAEGNLYEAQLGEESSVKRDRLREGMQVRASLDLVEGAYVVRELEPVRRGQRAQPQPQPQPQTQPQTTQPQPNEAR